MQFSAPFGVVDESYILATVKLMTEDRMLMDRRLYLWGGGVALLIVVFFVARSMVRERIPVHAAEVTRMEMVNTVSTNGRVEPETNFEVHAPLSATVKAVFVQSGQEVKAGQPLIELDDLEARAHVATAESGLKSAQAALEAITLNGSLAERQAAASDVRKAEIEVSQTKRDTEALERLAKSGAASKSEVNAAHARVQTAEANLQAASLAVHQRYSPAEVERARAAVRDAEAGLAEARATLAQMHVSAPSGGTIYSLGVNRTEFAEAGKTILQLADLHHVRVRAYFDEPEIGRLAVGQKIVVKWDARPGKMWHGHILRIPTTVITYGTRNVGEVLVDLDDADGSLLPDTNVSVTVTTSSEPNALTIPREALYTANGKYYVYKIVNETLVKTPVTIGTINLTHASIQTGLNQGDLVTTGAVSDQRLQDSAQIKVVQ